MGLENGVSRTIERNSATRPTRGVTAVVEAPSKFTLVLHYVAIALMFAILGYMSLIWTEVRQIADRQQTEVDRTTKQQEVREAARKRELADIGKTLLLLEDTQRAVEKLHRTVKGGD